MLIYNMTQEHILLKSEGLEEQIERNGAVLFALRQARPSPPPMLGDEVIPGPPSPLTPS